MAQQQITFYSAKICPYAHRVELALKEPGLSYNRSEIDLKAKPDWYVPKVNPASKVPALAYGGLEVSPDQPSPEAEKLAESMVLVEFDADLSGNIRPEKPALRAKARFFVKTFISGFISAWYATNTRSESTQGLLAAGEQVQALLPAEGYAIGEWSTADAADALEHDFGAYDEGEGKKVYEVLQNSPKSERIRKYITDVKGRKSFQETSPESLLEHYEI